MYFIVYALKETRPAVGQLGSSINLSPGQRLSANCLEIEQGETMAIRRITESIRQADYGALLLEMFETTLPTMVKDLRNVKALF